MAELDVLRGIAILLVLCSHYKAIPVFGYMWMGVDLFFVLSGFLVSGLLFRNYERDGTFHVKRFLIRRGLKIYPSFYFFLTVTVATVYLIRVITGVPFTNMIITPQRILAEVFYLQNYLPNIWGIDWTLAIEEHFYFLLAAIVLSLKRYSDPIRKVLWISVLFMVGILALRYEAMGAQGQFAGKHIVHTHLRIDSLFFGVFLSCIYRLYFERLKGVPVAVYFLMLFVGIATLIAWFAFNPGKLNYLIPFGYTVIYLCYGTILFAMIMIREYDLSAWKYVFEDNRLTGLLAMIGIYSYNIYLWHMFVIDALFAFATKFLHANIFNPFAWRYYFVYVIVSIVWGTLMAKLVEIPILKWRDRKYKGVIPVK